jgi:hypothetical protein
VVGWFLGLGVLPLALLAAAAVVLILLAPRRVPVRDRPLAGFDDGRDLTRFGWGHPMATSMLWGAALFGWFNGTGRGDHLGGAGDGLGGTDGLSGGFDGGGDFGGGGGSE